MIDSQTTLLPRLACRIWTVERYRSLPFPLGIFSALPKWLLSPFRFEVIFEQSSSAGSFFRRFPVHRMLISGLADGVAAGWMRKKIGSWELVGISYTYHLIYNIVNISYTTTSNGGGIEAGRIDGEKQAR